MYHRILFAYDGTERRALQALPHLVALARPMRAEVVLCHVLEVQGSVDVPDTTETTTPSADVTSNVHLEGIQKLLEDEGVEKVSALVLEGQPSERIVRAVADLECDAVVMVTAGRGWLGRFFHGSVADHVVRHTPSAAVLLLRADDEGDADSEDPGT